MDWLEHDEMMRQWEEVSKEAERIMMERSEGRKLKAEGAQTAPELIVPQA